MKARDAERLAFGLLATTAVVGFETWGDIDLSIAAAFYAGAGNFPAGEWPWVRAVYVVVPWVGRMMFAFALGTALLALWQPGRVPRHWWRRAVAMMLGLLIGLGALVHGVFKDHWGRPRPNEVVAFAGPHAFVPALHRSSACARNCSFVSGHAATGFALIGLGVFAAPRRRWRWLLVGVGAGAAIGMVRIAQGRHFASDIVFALLLMWGTTLLMRELWLRTACVRRHLRASWREGAPRVVPRASD